MRITVRRTGGMAGISREWSATVDAEEEGWRELLDRLPRDAAQGGADGADRFIYLVVCASDPETDEWRCEIPERNFTGPWQELLDRVRDTPE
ncbi:hypothetical protein OH146_13245 [Salinibacterium sp. SYSU T00001]|uniref:protealysin inhibitor emfourin n=1 Tax=Homoserinimonas sedimenticola TaxID=2986805 RepID=UPI002235B2B0|nr:protealysin inhibitor emfourin [Salinibacterium sedimenticola]MCW4386740.1 hypothetical protein [Salinibacterium sedimenticola]